jgi:hypothetical protein
MASPLRLRNGPAREAQSSAAEDVILAAVTRFIDGAEIKENSNKDMEESEIDNKDIETIER